MHRGENNCNCKPNVYCLFLFEYGGREEGKDDDQTLCSSTRSSIGMAATVDRRMHADQGDKRIHLQPSYTDDVGYGYGYGYGADYKSSGPSSNQVVALIAGVPIGGSLLALAGITLAGSVIGLLLSIPLFLLFSPVIVPAAITIGLAVTGILASGLFGLTGLSSVSWVLNYIRGTSESVPEQLDYAKRRVADAVGYAGQKGKEAGQYVQDRAHEAHDTSLTAEVNVTEPGQQQGGKARRAHIS